MPLARGFDHVAMLTTDMERSVHFYEQVLEAVVTQEISPSADHPWMKVVEIGGGAALNIFEVPADAIVGDRRRIGARGAIDHYGFAVESLDVLRTVRDRLLEAGAEAVGEIRPLGEQWSLFFRDPDGAELEVCCPQDVRS